jgi:tRNA modification GTPase
MYGVEDTIAAISTPIGEGGIGIVRMTGAEAVSIVCNLFVPVRRGQKLQSHCLHYGHIVATDLQLKVDEVLVSYMQAPNSYTREDVVEINCHGGIMPLQRVLGLCLHEGARLAMPGEFTLRAFLNGRIDLSQAEAVLDVIRAKTDAGLQGAMGQLEGRLSTRVVAVRASVLEVLAYLTATMDFTEHEIPHREIQSDLTLIQEELRELLRDADRGIIYKQGVRAAIVGRSNVGKSSLLNALLRTNRAIVTPVPGTTRDTLEETLNLGGVPVLLIDTAGFNAQSEDVAEQLGIERSRVALQQAGIVLWVIDGSEQLTDSDRAIAELLIDRPTLAVFNKADLPPAFHGTELPRFTSRVHLSALTGAGLPELESKVLEMLLGNGGAAADAPLVSSPRHKNAIERAHGHVINALQAKDASLPADFITIDLTAACEVLGEVTGEHVVGDLLSTIFSNFCIGK